MNFCRFVTIIATTPNKRPCGVAQGYRKAAEHGDDCAQNNLGVCYREGRGVERDYAEAKRWFEKAAAKGNEQARRNLENLTR